MQRKAEAESKAEEDARMAEITVSILILVCIRTYMYTACDQLCNNVKNLFGNFSVWNMV